MQTWFSTWFNSPYYHILYKNRSQAEANEFVQCCVDKLKFPKGIRLLDIACGKGRHAQAFASYELQVTGVDLAEASIEEAKKNETEFLEFFVHDMRQVFRTNYYDVVTNLFTSFGYFDSAHDNVLAARAMCMALKPNGQLLIDVVNQPYAFTQIAQHKPEKLELDGVEFDIEKSVDGSLLKKHITIHDKGNTETYVEQVNSFSLPELVALFTQVGLTHITTYGDYNLGAYDEQHSPRMIILFRK